MSFSESITYIYVTVQFVAFVNSKLLTTFKILSFNSGNQTPQPSSLDQPFIKICWKNVNMFNLTFCDFFFTFSHVQADCEKKIFIFCTIPVSWSIYMSPHWWIICLRQTKFSCNCHVKFSVFLPKFLYCDVMKWRLCLNTSQKT